MRRQLGICSDPCIQNQSEAVCHLNGRTQPLIQGMAYNRIIGHLSILYFILDDQPKIQILN